MNKLLNYCKPKIIMFLFAVTNGYLGTIVNAAGELRDLYAGRANYKEAFAMMVEMTTAADSMRNKDARSEVLLRELYPRLPTDPCDKILNNKAG